MCQPTRQRSASIDQKYEQCKRVRPEIILKEASRLAGSESANRIARCKLFVVVYNLQVPGEFYRSLTTGIKMATALGKIDIFIKKS